MIGNVLAFHGMTQQLMGRRMSRQEAVPADNSLVSLMLRTRNKETGAGLTDLQVVAQTNTFIAAGTWHLGTLV